MKMFQRAVNLFALCLSGIIVSGALAFADKIVLKSGDVIEGKILHEDDEYIVIEILEDGITGSIKLAKKYVLKVETTSEKDEKYKEKLKELDQTSAQDHFDLAIWCQSQSLEDEAIAHFTRAVELEPMHEGAHYALGHRRVGDEWVEGIDEKAAEHILTKEDWDRFEEKYTKAAMAFMDSRYKEAAILFEEALLINPYSKRANKDLALSYYKAELWGKARSHFEKILTDHPRDFNFRRNYAKVLLKLSETERAKKILIVLLDENNEDYDTWAAMAYVQYVEKDFDKSLKSYQKVYGILKDKGLDYVPNAHMGMGLCYTRLKRFDEAYKQFDTILKHDPLDLEAVYAFGMAKMGEGKTKEAMKKFKFYYDYSDEDFPHRIEVAKILKRKP